MTIVEQIAAVIMLLTAGVWSGVIVLYGVERINLWSKMPIEQYVVDFRRSVHRVDPLQPILGLVSLAGAVVFALNVGGNASTSAWAGGALIVVVVAMSIAFPERINTEFRKRKEGEAPPNAAELRARWRTLHFIRTVPAVGAFIALILATTLA